MILKYRVSFKDHQSRIDDFAYSQGISQKALKDIKMKGDILVDGIHQSVRYILSEGETIEFIFPKEENNITPVNIPLKIVYEDDYLLVIDKQKDLACIPTRSHPDYTLANALSYYYKTIHLSSTIHLVNRLDKETSGLMIVAKYRYVHDLFTKDLDHIYRLYRAHVTGECKEGTINKPIQRKDKEMRRFIDESGKPSITHYKCINYENDISYMHFRLETGRTHQIRVHMSSIGHPLIGDTLYGEDNGVFDLDSYKVMFTHPITKQLISIEKKDCKK